ncbi:hypothetical protein EDEG_03333 [Edhazardia aedis USNM 41457]|uniref:Transcription initiation factor IIA subunit 1 n=1 Tax=Edhazardia aedis (strain USNM 41457) TaxID=1003232 RepID=J9DHX1_EDHAE|nr:hypothetical protein EDEG_03333 [Edhazardia aedis USNM 41457]|eukprot:EJW02215.1 hypothetical protein EDEG_03333 [Edhazardia aedis USNM 41457]
MNFETSRVYRDIIEEVGRAIEEDTENIGLSLPQIQDLKLAWGRKLREMTSPPENMSYQYRSLDGFRPQENLAYKLRGLKSFEPKEPEKKAVKDYEKMGLDENLSDSSGYLSDESEDDLDSQLEAQYPNYMICLYVKVDKSKFKWRVKLKQGFLNIGKAEFVFDNAHGDLTWC